MIIVNLFGISNHIKIYDNALSKKECQILINQFEKSPQVEGGVYIENDYGIDHDHKKCMEMKGTHFLDKSVVSNILRVCINKQIDKYKEEFNALDNFIAPWKIDEGYTFQKYERKGDGYKLWHCEAGGHAKNRMLVWMFYLNDAKCGTEFYDYGTVKAKQGRCVIWPAFWTHVHRGVVPNIGLKYILSGWCSYK